MGHLQNILKDALIKAAAQILSAIEGRNAEAAAELERAVELSSAANPFFSRYMQLEALKAIVNNFLTESALDRLFDCCAGRSAEGKTVGIIMAGNIPAVGFHDLLCTLACGAKALVKLSSKDRYLVPYICGAVQPFWPQMAMQVEFLPAADGAGSKARGLFEECDMLIFSGSDESLAQVKRELLLCGKADVPLLGRSSRFSFGVLRGSESHQQLEGLASDIFLYCTLGCRSITTLFIPRGYNINALLVAMQCMREKMEQIPPYINSYKRLKALAAMQGNLTDGASAGKEESYTDGEFFLLKTIGSEIEKIEDNFPPLGVVNVRYYSNENEIVEFERANSNKIQKKYSKFGFAQQPQIDDWPDGANTVEFILSGKS